MVVLAAVAVGGWFLYDRFGGPAESRAAITEACEGMVDPGALMRFAGSGRKVEARSPGDRVCLLTREVTFEGENQMEDFFSLWVVASHDAEPGESRFAFTDRSVTVTAKCADPARSAGVTALRVTAGTEFDAAKRGAPGALPALAREAALRAAAKAGCDTTLPAAPNL
ncbi:hypothetical protein GCM10010302_74730 [Streptomyces polychromogenes]|uniref:DUF4307 domain-containing protein n=1 Tax=Streptomyces polychromogenes TaxID=67342 RepID=A0ABN0W465_9ACTN